MPRARRSRTWRLWALGVAAFLVAATRSRTRAPREAHSAIRADSIAETATEATRPRVAIALAAAASVALLAVAIIGVLQVNQTLEDSDVAETLTGGDPTRAAALATRYGCAGCHTIPGLPGAHGQAAPPLAGLRKRVYLAGVVRNTADNLVQWIVDPASLSPQTAMPVTGISRREAADVAAYLYAH
jgi:cytochrome c